MKNSIGYIVGVILVFTSSVYAWQWYRNSNNVTIQPEAANVSMAEQFPLVTDQAFQELTIPYLRQRTYQSQLSELQPLSTAGNYDRFLTSYDSDGLEIHGLLTRPTGPMPEGGWPAIVFVHGYIPPTLYKTQERYVEYVHYLARSGFVVFKIDLRGHGDSQGEAGGAYYSSDYIIDTLHAYTALSQTDFVNPKQIGLWGHSMAGNVLLRTIAARPEIPATVIWGGAGFSYDDLQEFGIDDNSYRPPSSTTPRQQQRQKLYDTHGRFEANNPFWQTVVPTNYLGDLQGAIQLHHATDDEVVSVEYSRNLNTLLDRTSVPHEFYEYPSGGHNVSGGSFSQAMQRTVEFYRKYLQSE